MPSLMTHVTAIFGAFTTFLTIRFWQLLGPLLIRYETAIVIMFFILMYIYVYWLLKYHEPLMKAQNLIQYDMMRTLHFEVPKFIQMGFRDLEKTSQKSWQLNHKNFSFFANQGKRNYMEDRMHYIHDVRSHLSIFSIFDGHGGNFVSNFLEEHFSKNMRKRLLYWVPSRKSSIVEEVDAFHAIKQAIVTEVHKIDDEIRRLHQHRTSTTGSTLISAILEQNRFLTVVNVGDSRAIACDFSGKAVVLSRDHKPSDALERRRIESAGGFIENFGVDRVQGVLAVSRAFGDNSLKLDNLITAHPDIVRIDLVERPLRYLLVASDGFFDVFGNQEAIDFANQFLEDKGTFEWSRLASTLVIEALDRGTEDNVSVLECFLISKLERSKESRGNMTSMCGFIRSLEVGTDLLEPEVFRNLSLLAGNVHQESVSRLNRITYAYITPIIITIGVIGDILTVATLTHPLLRRSNIVYTYLTLLAMTDLLTHISVIPMIFWLLDWRLCSEMSAFYYAHIGFPLANALMGASVWIVVFLTLSQYMAVCHPFSQGFFKKRKMCFWLFAIAYLFNFCIYAPWATKKTVYDMCFWLFAIAYLFNFCIYAPWATKKTVYDIPGDLTSCPFLVCDSRKESWFQIYEWIREFLTRVFPFMLIAFFNIRIMITYRSTKRDRMKRLASSQTKRAASERSEQEERRLFVLLFAIIIVFFCCTIPAAPLTIFVADNRSQNLTFQIIRAIVNLLEFTKFALNFYFYCLINPDIRRISWHIIQCRKLNKPARVKGQPVNPISIYTRSTKSTVKGGGHGDSSRRGSKHDDCRSRSASFGYQMRSRSASMLTNIMGTDNVVYDQLQVIKESDSSNDCSKIEVTSAKSSLNGSPSRLGDDLKVPIRV
uniref:Uncharacterized protein n=1 Tax=Panagrolaimus sp. JU765 TaxID=591449 RepID=A0AC34Q9G0_9BILA